MADGRLSLSAATLASVQPPLARMVMLNLEAQDTYADKWDWYGITMGISFHFPPTFIERRFRLLTI